MSRRLRTVAAAMTAATVVASIAGIVWTWDDEPPLPSFEAQACGLPAEWLERIQRGYFAERSGQISLLPRQPAYMASGRGGWSHSGPWPYLQDIPLVFYGPGVVPERGDVERDVTLADVAPTIATLLRGVFETDDGASLDEVVKISARLLESASPRLIVVVVWDGGGWNTLEQWPDRWPVLARMMREGVSFTNATVGSSPSVTPAVHSTLGTGVFPRTHGITGVPVRDEDGEVVDSFLKGESTRFLQVPTIAERWDTQNDGAAHIGMVGYEPWHLGMIGKGAETAGADRDDAAWLDVDSNEWVNNPDHYRMPGALPATTGLDDDLEELDAADGKVDGAWRGRAILEDRDRVEETPAFIAYHARALLDLVKSESYGDDGITDLLFTNFKQIDRVGHYFNMASPEVRDSVEATDRALGDIERGLDATVGRGRWVVVVTADHGQQPDAAAIDGYGIDPNEVERDIDDEFGPITDAVWPTEAFLDDEALAREGVSVADVARFLGDYRLSANDPEAGLTGVGEFEGSDRIFAMAVPSEILAEVECAAPEPASPTG